MNRAGSTVDTTRGRWNAEGVPPGPDPQGPPLTPHDPPDPVPQAAAWDRALRVIFMESTQSAGSVKGRSWRANRRGRAAIRAAQKH